MMNVQLLLHIIQTDIRLDRTHTDQTNYFFLRYPRGNSIQSSMEYLFDSLCLQCIFFAFSYDNSLLGTCQYKKTIEYHPSAKQKKNITYTFANMLSFCYSLSTAFVILRKNLPLISSVEIPPLPYLWQHKIRLFCVNTYSKVET